MEKTKEIEHRRIQQYFKPFVKDTLENIDFDYQYLNQSEINRYKIQELRKIYHSSLPFEKSWLKCEYPKVKNWQIKWFPRAWMNAENNPQIAQAIERCPSFLPIINYLFDYNRYWSGTYKDERKKMKALADNITGAKRYKGRGGNYVFATFITGQAFYKEICKATGCSKNTIQRYLKALTKI
jgi:hypothetical protein